MNEVKWPKLEDGKERKDNKWRNLLKDIECIEDND